MVAVGQDSGTVDERPEHEDAIGMEKEITRVRAGLAGAVLTAALGGDAQANPGAGTQEPVEAAMSGTKGSTEQEMRTGGKNWIGWSSMGVAVGTGMLALATLWLTWEVRATRTAEAAWRAEDRAAKGLEPFLGKYAEPGVVDLQSGVNLNRKGTTLEVNHYGAVLLSEDIGYFAGGYLEIVEGQTLVFEMGKANSLNHEQDGDRHDGMRPEGSFFHIAELNRSGWKRRDRLWKARTGRSPPRERGDWDLTLKGWIDGEWKSLKTIELVKYTETVVPAWYRALAASGEPFDQQE